MKVARYEHLRLVRLPERLERRKQPGFGQALERDRGEHSTRLRQQLESAVQEQRRRRQLEAINPSLILRIQLARPILEEEWERVGLTLLSSDADRSLVLFSSSDDMREFKARLEAYAGEIPESQKGAPYAGFVSSIESIGSVEPRDRIGVSLRDAGIAAPSDFDESERVLDVELWDLGGRTVRQGKAEEVAAVAERHGGEVIDVYVGPSITMLRVRINGPATRELLALDDVASVDLPPVPDIANCEALELPASQVPKAMLSDDAPAERVNRSEPRVSQNL